MGRENKTVRRVKNENTILSKIVIYIVYINLS